MKPKARKTRTKAEFGDFQTPPALAEAVCRPNKLASSSELTKLSFRVAVHWNFHKNLFSVVGAEGRVLEHVEEFQLRKAYFCVGKKVRERVLREQIKNVHARIRGELLEHPESTKGWRLVKYNPYAQGAFVTLSGERPVLRAEAVIGRVVEGHAKVYAKGILYL